MKKFFIPLIASIAILFLSGCYVSEVSYTTGYHRPAVYGHPGYYGREPYYDRGPYYSRSEYPYATQSRYYGPSRYPAPLPHNAPSPYHPKYKHAKSRHPGTFVPLPFPPPVPLIR